MNKEKVLSVSIKVLAAAVICLAVVQLAGIWDGAIRVCEPLIGVILLLLAVQQWDKNRRTAILYLCAALFVLAVAAYVLLF